MVPLSGETRGGCRAATVGQVRGRMDPFGGQGMAWGGLPQIAPGDKRSDGRCTFFQPLTVEGRGCARPAASGVD
jgi:hypothetical protein